MQCEKHVFHMYLCFEVLPYSAFHPQFGKIVERLRVDSVHHTWGDGSRGFSRKILPCISLWCFVVNHDRS